MTLKDTSSPREPPGTVQSLHLEAAVHLEKALQHHMQAARLHDEGEARQAEEHAGIAYSNTAHALEVGGRALNILRW